MNKITFGKRCALIAQIDFRITNKNKSQLTNWVVLKCSSSDFDNIPEAIKHNGHIAKNLTICGTNLPEIDKVPIRFYGQWVQNKKYGNQFSADSYELMKPSSIIGIQKLLSSKMFQGVGLKTAERLTDAFGENILDIIENEPDKLLQVQGISAAKAASIKQSYDDIRAYSRLVAFLAQYQISAGIAMKIFNHYGESSQKKIEADPYCLGEINGIGFKTCDKIGKARGIALNSYRRISGALLEVLKSLCVLGGHMFIHNNELMYRTLQVLNDGIQPEPVDTASYVKTINKLIQDKKICVINKDEVYSWKSYNAEFVSSRRLLALVKQEISGEYISRCKKALANYCQSSSIQLHETQSDAVINSLTHRVSIITGGPGTGKTTILSAILACYRTVYQKPITLIAPTGKAARGMSESTHMDASTIHSKLRLYNAEGHKQKPQPIKEGLIVIDECSMVDNYLMQSLMEAIDINNCHVIFVGDIDQLPSVGEGAVLGEMIQSGVIPTSRLTKTFRQKDGGETIIENAKKVNSGLTELEYDDTFQFIPASSDEEAAQLIEKLYVKETQRCGIDNVALLCPLRRSQDRFKCVVDEMNQTLQAVVNPNDSFKVTVTLNGKRFRTGDRVMQWKNTEDSSNGDIGYIKNIYENDEGITVIIEWENGITSVLTQTDMESITQAYALSIHKSQGSEYESVIIPVLSEQLGAIHKRNLLYTGITRAKKHVILVGDTDAISKTIMQSDTNKRNTNLAKRLIFNYKEGGNN